MAYLHSNDPYGVRCDAIESNGSGCTASVRGDPQSRESWNQVAEVHGWTVVALTDSYHYCLFCPAHGSAAQKKAKRRHPLNNPSGGPPSAN